MMVGLTKKRMLGTNKTYLGDAHHTCGKGAVVGHKGVCGKALNRYLPVIPVTRPAGIY